MPTWLFSFLPYGIVGAAALVAGIFTGIKIESIPLNTCKASYANYEATVATEAAKANALAAAQAKADAATLAKASQSYETELSAARAQSQALQDALNHVPQNQRAGLSPAVRAYLERLRGLQSPAHP